MNDSPQGSLQPDNDNFIEGKSNPMENGQESPGFNVPHIQLAEQPRRNPYSQYEATEPLPTTAAQQVEPDMPITISDNVRISDGLTNSGVSKKKNVIIIFGALLLLFGISAALFYTLYWTRSDVVYGRFQNILASVITATSNTEVKIIDNVSYKFEGTSESKSSPFTFAWTSRTYNNSSDTKIDLNLNSAKLNLAFLTIDNADSKSFFDLYLKWRGIGEFYNVLTKQPSSKDLATSINPYVSLLKKYDDKWISIDLSSIVGAVSSANSEKITTKDFDSLKNALVPIFNDRFVGLDKNNAVVSTVNQKSEQVNGRDCWSYELKYNDSNFNAMIDAMIKAVGTTTLSTGNKKTVKDLLSLYKRTIDTPKVDSPINTTSVSPILSTTQKDTVWLDKLTGIPIRFSMTSSSTYNNQPYNSMTNTFDITELSTEKIKAKLLTNAKSRASIVLSANPAAESESESTIQADLLIDNKALKNSLTVRFDPETKKSDDAFTGSLTQEQASNKGPITKPAPVVPWKQVIDELSKSQKTLFGA